MPLLPIEAEANISPGRAEAFVGIRETGWKDVQMIHATGEYCRLKARFSCACYLKPTSPRYFSPIIECRLGYTNRGTACEVVNYSVIRPCRPARVASRERP